MYHNLYRVSNKEVWGQKYNNPNTSKEEQDWFQLYVRKFVNLALARIEYENLPDEIPPIMIESYLLWQGLAVLAKNETVDMYGVFGVNLVGEPDIYGIPIERIAYGQNGAYFDFLSKDDSVLMWARPFAVPEILDIFQYAQLLAESKVTQMYNLVQQRTPVLVYGSETSKLAQDNFIQKLLKGIPFLRVKNDFRSQIQAEALDLKVNPQYNDLSTFQLKTIADCLGGLGIECTGIEKPERLVSNETGYNNGEIETTRKSILECRQRAIDAFNKMFGLNVQVRWNSDMITPINTPDAFNPMVTDYSNPLEKKVQDNMTDRSNPKVKGGQK